MQRWRFFFSSEHDARNILPPMDKIHNALGTVHVPFHSFAWKQREERKQAVCV